MLSATVLVVALSTPLAAQDPNLRYLKTRSLKLPIETLRAGAAPIAEHQLFYTLDQGKTWRVAEVTAVTPNDIKLTVPHDGTYGFVVIAIDKAGHQEMPPQPGTRPEVTCVVDTEAPRLEVLEPRPGAQLYAGGLLPLSWEIDDAHLGATPVQAYYRRQGDEVWQRVENRDAYPAKHRMQWHPPVASGTLEVRLVAVDLAGNVSEWQSTEGVPVLPFDGFRGTRVMLADDYSMFRRFALHYVVSDIEPLFVDRVEIWYRSGFGDWTAELDENRTSPYVFQAHEDGAYFYYLRIVGRDGRSTRPLPGPDTLPDLRVVVDTHPPRGTLVLGDGEPRPYHRAGDTLEIEWSVEDENLTSRGARLELSLDGGRTWQTFLDQLSSPAGRGTYAWRPPFIESNALTVRLLVEDLARNRTVVAARSFVHLLNPKLDPLDAAQQHRQRAVMLAAAGDRDSLEHALENLDVALQYNPRQATAFHDRGVVKTRLQRHGEALVDYRQALDLQPGDLNYTFSLVRGYLNLHRLGLDAEGNAPRLARAAFGGINKVEIYKHESFQDLVSTYKQLEAALEEL